ncbi:hypothetical protein [Marinisporobacter balticus]|uniref:Uncharacterized protein n=1 Tax=Marinisporobacter balticus TaxID=2018667 RepID=A0A4R2KEA2_9FIRM|nr:hypothetical protein [Marinisporobacter balticus]TCO71843.1 hypothetical protein EV214_12063 [Marinisporobacter balticus]
MIFLKGKISSVNIVKYRKIENLKGIIDEMQYLLRNEENVNKKYLEKIEVYVGIKENLEKL